MSTTYDIYIDANIEPQAVRKLLLSAQILHESDGHLYGKGISCAIEHVPISSQAFFAESIKMQPRIVINVILDDDADFETARELALLISAIAMRSIKGDSCLVLNGNYIVIMNKNGEFHVDPSTPGPPDKLLQFFFPKPWQKSNFLLS